MTDDDRPSTIEDVARRSGVSVATVSRALRGLPNVAPSTRKRVEEAAELLHYQPDPSAARLASGRSRTVAMAVPDLGSWYFGKVMAAVESVMAAAGYDLLVVAVDSEAARLRLTRGPLVKRADGLILVDLPLSADEASSLMASRVHVVSVGSAPSGASSVRIDDVRVAELAVDHLLELGHTRIGLLAGVNDDPLHFEVPIDRRHGYRRALARAGVEPDDRLERVGSFTVEGGYDAMRSMLQAPEPPTAVFAMGDEMAFGALRAIWETGADVPEDVSVVGVDDHELSAVVGLTTVRQNVAEHGSLAAQLLLDRLSGRSTETASYQVPIALIERRTTAPPDRTDGK